MTEFQTDGGYADKNYNNPDVVDASQVEIQTPVEGNRHKSYLTK